MNNQSISKQGSVPDDNNTSSVPLIIDLNKRNQEVRGQLKRANQIALFYQIAIGVLAIAIVLLAVVAFRSNTTYFAVDSFGGYTQVRAFEEPYLSQEKRIEYAERIVRNLNSLSFIDYKSKLDEMERMFMPATWAGYKKAMEQKGFFSLIEGQNLKYVASVSPARLIANNSKGVVYSNPDCYSQVVLSDGSAVTSDCSANTIEAGGHSETYEFPVRRTVYANAKEVETIPFVVRLELTKMDSGERKNGYVVTRYEESY